MPNNCIIIKYLLYFFLNVHSCITDYVILCDNKSLHEYIAFLENKIYYNKTSQLIKIIIIKYNNKIIKL